MIDPVKWICCQYGAREFYSIPRGLDQVGIPNYLITDTWFNKDRFPWKHFPKIHSRYHRQIPTYQVKAFNVKLLIDKIAGSENTEEEFSKLAASYIRLNRNKKFDQVTTLFSYSYSAKRVFEMGKELGLKTIMGQINPGPREAEIVVEAFKKEFGDRYSPNVPGERYWNNWRKECELADFIIVNSKWSEKLMVEEGVPPFKIKVIPLAYEFDDFGSPFNRVFKEQFTKRKPLKVLYLGSISVRKGFHILKKAFHKLNGAPVKLSVVGKVNGPKELLENLPKNIDYLGSVSPVEISTFYKDSDLFILPTLSDGFARTLLEAQHWKLPVITSPFCGEVIINNKNGLVIPEVNEELIVESIQNILNNPKLLPHFSTQSNDLSSYSLKKIGEKLIQI